MLHHLCFVYLNFLVFVSFKFHLKRKLTTIVFKDISFDKAVFLDKVFSLWICWKKFFYWCINNFNTCAWKEHFLYKEYNLGFTKDMIINKYTIRLSQILWCYDPAYWFFVAIQPCLSINFCYTGTLDKYLLSH